MNATLPFRTSFTTANQKSSYASDRAATKNAIPHREAMELMGRGPGARYECALLVERNMFDLSRLAEMRFANA